MRLRRPAVALACLLFSPVPIAARSAYTLTATEARDHVQSTTLTLKIEDVMAAQELAATCVSGLTEPQRKAPNVWLNKYTGHVVNVVKEQHPRTTGFGCVPAVESTIEDEFNGWEGETIFKLDNGEIWQQAEYDYMYSYSYRPEATIYETACGCRMKVEGEDETILVKRIR